jgi:signal transduction histidine kinase
MPQGAADNRRFAARMMDSLLESIDERHGLAPQVHGSRLQLLLARGNFSTLSGIPMAVLMAYVASQHIPMLWVSTWLIAKVLISLVRVVASKLQTREESPSSEASLNQFAALAGVDGLVWGCSALWALQGLPTDLIGLFIACLVGVAAAGVFVLYASLRASLAFSVPVLIPAMAVALWPGSPLAWYVAAGLALYTMVLVVEARRMRAQLITTLRLRFGFEIVGRERETAQQAALNLSHVRDQFVTTLGDQMRSPVSGIVGIARTLACRPGFSNPSDLNRLRLMEHAGEHVLRLIDDVLDYTRFSTGQTPLVKQPFDLALLIDEVTQLAMVEATQRNLALEITPGSALFSGTPTLVAGDAVRVRQVFEHMISHAMRSIDVGEIKLTAHHNRGNGLLDMSITSHGAENASVVALTLKVLRDTDRDDTVSGVLGLGLSRRYARAMNGDVLARRGPASVLTLLLQVELPAV